MIGKGYLSIALAISALFLASGLLIIQSIQSGSAQGITGTFTADLQPRSGSNASGTATLEIQDNGKTIHYNIDATGLSNVTDISISQQTGTGRAPDVVILRTASQSGLGKGSGSLSGNFTESELRGPLEGKNLADFVKAINDEKIIIRVQTVPFPLGEIIGNVTAGDNGGSATAGDDDLLHCPSSDGIGRSIRVVHQAPPSRRGIMGAAPVSQQKGSALAGPRTGGAVENTRPR